MSIITLTTDFGLKDYFVGALKGKLISEFPEVQIIDISHDVDLFNISETSYIINASFNNFPKNTVHLIGVDCERNSTTKHIVMQWSDHFFICADNGILSALTQKIVPQKIVEINIHDRMPAFSNALDVFVKVACHLAKGGAMSVIGKEISEIKIVNELQATASSDNKNIKGNIVYIDHFGNCITNISRKMFTEVGLNRKFEIKFGTKTIKRINNFYADFKITDDYSLKNYEGEKLAIFNEAGFLEIAIYKSNPKSVGTAKLMLGLKYRDVINIQFNS